MEIDHAWFLWSVTPFHWFKKDSCQILVKVCARSTGTGSLLREPASVAQLDALSDWRLGGRGFNPCQGRQHSFVEIDHEIFSMVILSLPLIPEGQLSVSGESMCTILVNRLEDWARPVNVWLGKLTALDMTPLGWLGRKTSTQTNKLLLRGLSLPRKSVSRLTDWLDMTSTCWLGRKTPN